MPKVPLHIQENLECISRPDFGHLIGARYKSSFHLDRLVLPRILVWRQGVRDESEPRLKICLRVAKLQRGVEVRMVNGNSDDKNGVTHYVLQCLIGCAMMFVGNAFGVDTAKISHQEV